MNAISRRRFIHGTSMAALAMHPISKALAAELNGRHLLLVGTSTGRSGSKGVYKYAFDSKTGGLEQLDVTECNNPQFMALSPDQKYPLFTLNGGFVSPGQAPPPPPQPGQRQRGGGAGGAVSSWAFNNKTGAMTLINEVSAGSGGGAYICVDPPRHLRLRRKLRQRQRTVLQGWP